MLQASRNPLNFLGNAFMRDVHPLSGAICGIPLLLATAGLAQQPSAAPLPEIHQLMHEVQEHQRQLDKVRENYTYTSLQTIQDLDSNGHVTQTKTTENEDFFVNSHVIERTVKKDGKPLDEHDEKKETERVTKAVEKAQKTPAGQLMDQQVSISQVLEVMDVRNPRRQLYHDRPMIVFDFIGRKDAKTHGVAEDASKKIQGTLWVDEADRVVAHLDASFDDNFRLGGGLLATVQKGSNFHFEQSPVNGELWLPVGAEGSVQARLVLLKKVRQHFTERDYDFKRFSVDAQQGKDVKVLSEKKQ